MLQLFLKVLIILLRAFLEIVIYPAFSASVKPKFFCFHTQKAAKSANPPHMNRYLMRTFGVVMYSVNTRKAYIIWYAMDRAVVYHAATSIPMPHVSFITSKVQKPHHISKTYNMILAVRSNFASLTSMMANAINMISSISLYNEVGIPIAGKFFHCTK